MVMKVDGKIPQTLFSLNSISIFELYFQLFFSRQEIQGTKFFRWRPEERQKGHGTQSHHENVS